MGRIRRHAVITTDVHAHPAVLAWAAVTGSSSNPLASIAAAKAWASPSILPSRALMAISQIEAADTYTACAEAR